MPTLRFCCHAIQICPIESVAVRGQLPARPRSYAACQARTSKVAAFPVASDGGVLLLRPLACGWTHRGRCPVVVEYGQYVGMVAADFADYCGPGGRSRWNEPVVRGSHVWLYAL